MKNQNMKKVIFSVIGVVVVVAVIVAVATHKPADSGKNTTASAPESSASQQVESSSNTTAQPTEQTSSTTESTTKPSDTTAKGGDSKAPAAISGGYWYLYDEKNTACYVFSFGDNGAVDLAVFSEDNINEEDAKYYTGYAEYKLNGKTITFKKLPKEILLKDIKLTLNGNNLVYDGKNLAHHDDLKIDYAIGYKTALDMMK
ncbi:MAG: hypothetical protein PUG26_00780 [Oscillospiraceae bacterium]|nr:hypothetical protein [Oscillospiraceae bacterium]